MIPQPSPTPAVTVPQVCKYSEIYILCVPLSLSVCLSVSLSLSLSLIRLDISCESSAWQMIHMNCETLCSLKNTKENQNVTATVIRTLRVTCYDFMESLCLQLHIFIINLLHLDSCRQHFKIFSCCSAEVRLNSSKGDINRQFI